MLRRVFDIDRLHCLTCGGRELKFVAAILERSVVEKILTRLGLDLQPPSWVRTREPGPHFVGYFSLPFRFG